MPIRRDAGCGFGHRKGSAARMAWRRGGVVLAALAPPRLGGNRGRPSPGGGRLANGYASVATRGGSGKRGGGQPCPSRPLRGVLGEGWRERVAGDGGESSSVSARGASIGLSVKLADWSSFLSFVGQRPKPRMMPWMAESRRRHPRVVGEYSGRRWSSSPDQPAWRSPCSISRPIRPSVRWRSEATPVSG
ncbi:hypothetical protein ACVINI_007360 [Rhizobium beringeri]